MSTIRSLPWNIWLLLSRAGTAAAQGSSSDARSLPAALQNINGMSAIFSLLPVLTGKTQNVKAIAGRIFPGALAVTGLGAGRVLSKLQIGIMLLSADLYRNLVGDLSYYHQEYVNAFSPPLIHIPTGTPERHSSNVIVNHNPTEDYMVEAWFQTQGVPAKVELSQRNNRRVFCSLLVYLLMYSLETFLCVQNAATGTGIPLIILQAVSGVSWIVAMCILQAARGQGKQFICLNRLATADYRCFQLVVSGKHVQSAVLSTQLSNIRDYNLFDSKYESKRLKVVGFAMVVSGTIDIFTTILVVGLNDWAYGWLGLQILLIAVKVIFSLEPIRRVPIVNVQAMPGESSANAPSTPVTPSQPTQQSGRKTRLPIIVSSAAEFSFSEVCISNNVVLETATQATWHSRSAGLFIGQPYYMQRPKMPEKKGSADSATTVATPSTPTTHTPPSTEKRVQEPEKTPISATSPIPEKTPTSPVSLNPPLSPTASNCASPTSSEASSSTSTVVPSPSALPEGTTAIPRIVVSTDSPTTAVSPVSPALPPGISIVRSNSLTSSVKTRAPTPPAKSPARSATLPSRTPPPALSSRAASNITPQRPKPVQPSAQPPVAPPVPLIAHPRPKQQPSVTPSPPPPPPPPEPVRYLALKDGKLTLSETEPPRESNQALQREFLACLAEVVRSNKVPSTEFLLAVETMREGIRQSMADNWYTFGTTDLVRYMRASYQDILWRRLV